MSKKNCLTKADLVDSIFSMMPIDKNQANQILEDFIELMKTGIEEDEKVMISGFGSFEVNSKSARRGRNPQTGDSIILRARKVVKFKPSQILRKSVNNDGTPITEEEDSFASKSRAPFR